MERVAHSLHYQENLSRNKGTDCEQGQTVFPTIKPCRWSILGAAAVGLLGECLFGLLWKDQSVAEGPVVNTETGAGGRL